MATAREHLRESHQKAAKHHTALSSSHERMSEYYRTLAGLAKGMKSRMDSEEDPSECTMAIAEEHDRMSKLHATHAQYHAGAAEACMKAAADGDLNKLIPTEVSVVAPDRPNIRPVPRTGGPPLQQAAADPHFSKILGLRAEDMENEELSLFQ